MLFGTRWRPWLATVGVASTVTLAPPAVRAAGVRKPSYDELEQRVRRLEQLLEKQQQREKLPPKTTTSAPEAAPAAVDQQTVETIVDEKIKKQKILAGWKDGFYLESPGGDMKLKFRGLVQADSRWFPTKLGEDNNDSFYMRRVRPTLEGTLFKYFDFKIMPDFGLGQTVLQDAYGEVTYWQEAKTRFGKFKTPFSLERLQSAADVEFVERSLAQNLAPNRDVGVQVSGDLLDGTFLYQLAGLNGNIDGGSNDGDTTNGKDIAGRVFATPLVNTDVAWAKGLGIGVAGTFGQSNNDSLSSLNWRTQGRATFFKYDTSSQISIVTNGNRHRLAPQAYYYWGPFGFMSEGYFNYEDVKRTQTFAKPKKGPTPKPKVTELDDTANYGWFAQVSWVLTGEDASFKGVNPINPFDPRQGRWGAFELAFRVSGVTIDEALFEDAFASTKSSTTGALEYTAGVNWYLNKYLKFQLNYGRTNYDNPITFTSVGPKPRDHEDVILTEFQVAF